MTTHRECRELDVSPEQVFDLVADVERYPEFLPSWQHATVRPCSVDEYDTEQTVGVGLLARRFRTHTHLDRPRRILVTSDEDAFRRFSILWEFAPTPGGGCRIDFSLDFTVESWLLQPAVDMLLVPTASSIVSAFERRARAVAASAVTSACH